MSSNFAYGMLIDGFLVLSIGVLSMAGMCWMIWKILTKLGAD